MRIIGANNTTGDSPSANLQNHWFRQEFLSPLDSLHKVEIMFAVAPELEDQELSIEIVDPITNQSIRQVTAIAKKNEQDTFIPFEFEPISNSKQKKYELVIGSQESDQVLELKVSDADYYQRGDLYLDGNKVPRDLVFRTFHQIDSSYSSFVLDSFISKVQVDPIFFIFWFILILTSAVIACFGFIHALFLIKHE